MDFESKYDVLEELGKGMFGVVKKCVNKETGDVCAAKIVRKTTKSKKEVTREIAMMNQLSHNRLAQIYDAFETSKQMVIVMEFISGVELFEKIVLEDHNLTELQAVQYMKQILLGVQHMHEKSIVHLDLKPENILCVHGGNSSYEEIKLIDFGLAREIKAGVNETVICGTPEFVAPEVISYDPVSTASDMWSLGVITYVLLTGMSPFLGDDDSETLQNVTAGEYDFEDEDGEPQNISEEAKTIIEGLLVMNPRKRLTVEQCLKHEWMVNYSQDHVLDTSKLKKYLTRRKWKKTINAIKAVGRFSLGLSLFKNRNKTNTASTPECPDIPEADHKVSEKIEKESQGKIWKSDISLNISSDEGISEGDADHSTDDQEDDNDRQTSNDVEDNGYFETNDSRKCQDEEKTADLTITSKKIQQRKARDVINEETDGNQQAMKLPNKEIEATKLPNKEIEAMKLPNKEIEATKLPNKEIESTKLPNKEIENKNKTTTVITKASREEEDRNCRPEKLRDVTPSRTPQQSYRSTSQSLSNAKTTSKTGKETKKTNEEEIKAPLRSNRTTNKEHTKMAFIPKFAKSNGQTSIEKTVGSPFLNRRTSKNNVLPSQLQRSKTFDEIVVDKQKLNRTVASNASKPSPFERSTKNIVRSSLRRLHIDENGNHTKNTSAISRKQSCPVVIRGASGSIKDRMAIFQGK